MCFVSLGCGHICGIPVDLMCAARVDLVWPLDLSLEAFMLRRRNQQGTWTSNDLPLKLGKGPWLQNFYFDVMQIFTHIYTPFLPRVWSMQHQMNNGDFLAVSGLYALEYPVPERNGCPSFHEGSPVFGVGCLG